MNFWRSNGNTLYCFVHLYVTTMENTVARIKNELEDTGYKTTMIFVNTDLETALRRNKNRPRSLPTELIHKNYAVKEQNLGRFQRLFNDVHLINNSESAQDTMPEQLEQVEIDVRRFLL